MAVMKSEMTRVMERLESVDGMEARLYNEKKASKVSPEDREGSYVVGNEER